MGFLLDVEDVVLSVKFGVKNNLRNLPEEWKLYHIKGVEVENF